jgi:hypothetical protein
MKKQIFTAVAVCAATFSIGQNRFAKNDLYIEAGGNGLFGSVNYERQLTNQPGPGVRVGVGFYSEDGFYLTIPVGINYLFKLNNKKAFLDAGLGVTWTRLNGELFGKATTGDDHFVNFIPSIGYRRHTVKNVMWRISVTPVANKYGFVPWLGVSIGKRF